MGRDLRQFISNDIRQHPRVAYQRLISSEKLTHVIGRIPQFVPFKSDYIGAISIIDWDHKLPSEVMIFRIFGFYTKETLSAGYEVFDDRLEAIGEKDRYPEFDVPDFDNLSADEAYEIPLGLDGTLGECRLTSMWRRSISSKESSKAISIVKKSKAYREIQAENRNRLRGLGDLEAVSWTPPCESEHRAWTIDVWYLLTFDGRIGTGQSLLVDLNLHRVVGVREFSVKAG